MQIISVFTTIKSPKFDTYLKAEQVLDKVTPDTKIISLDGLQEVMSSPLHHIIISLCIKENYGWEFVKGLKWETDDNMPIMPMRDKLNDALKFAEEIYGETKPSPDTTV